MIRDPWHPPWHRRLLWRVRRFVALLNPISALHNVAASGWGEVGYTESWRTRVADAVLWKWYVARAILRCAFSAADDELQAFPLWQRPLYRGKTILCLLFGRHWPGESYAFDSVAITSWDWESVGYYEPEMESSHVDVGEGWGCWYVELTERRLWP